MDCGGGWSGREVCGFSVCARQLREEGYTVVPNFLSAKELEALEQECSTLVEVATEKGGADPSDSEWAARSRGCIFQPLPVQVDASAPAAAFRTEPQVFSCRRSSWPCKPAVRDMLLGARMAELAGAMLGRPAFLYNDQYIVKPARSRLASFQWHRDSDWCRGGQFHYSPYISVWCAIDDMDQGNGTLVIAPFDTRQCGGVASTDCAPAALPSTSSELYNDPKLRVVAVKAGDAVVMSDLVWHCSGPNASAFARRAWMPQFSAAPISHAGSGHPVSLAVPLPRLEK